MRAVNRLASCHREWSAALRIPYTAHVSTNLVKTYAGHFVEVFRLAGASFESANDEELNDWHERLNVTFLNVSDIAASG